MSRGRSLDRRNAQRRTRELRARLASLVAECEAEGVEVMFVEFVEDAETPGLLGMWAGIWIPHLRKIKVSTHGRQLEERVAILEHEMEHMRGAEWATDHEHLGLRCGGRVSGGTLANVREVS